MPCFKRALTLDHWNILKLSWRDHCIPLYTWISTVPLHEFGILGILGMLGMLGFHGFHLFLGFSRFFDDFPWHSTMASHGIPWHPMASGSTGSPPLPGARIEARRFRSRSWRVASGCDSSGLLLDLYWSSSKIKTNKFWLIKLYNSVFYWSSSSQKQLTNETRRLSQEWARRLSPQLLKSQFFNTFQSRTHLGIQMNPDESRWIQPACGCRPWKLGRPKRTLARFWEATQRTHTEASDHTSETHRGHTEASNCHKDP